MTAVARVAVAAVPLALVPALGAAGGGYQPDTWVWAGALAAWGAALALVFLADGGALGLGWPWVVASAGVLGWTAVSAWWSTNPSQSLLEARRAVVYTTVVLALLALARRGTQRTLVLATHVAISALLVYALVRYLLGARHLQAFEGYLLNEPLGYANALGILAALAIVLALGLASAPQPGAVQFFAAATLPALALALVLSGSHASWLALGVGIATAVLADTAPSRTLATLALAGPTAAFAAWLGHYSRLTGAAPRISGLVVLLVTGLCAAIAGGSVHVARRRAGELAVRTRKVLVIGFLCLVAGGVALAVHEGASQPRASYWHVAWREYVDHPLLGSGAGTFGGFWLASGPVLRYGGALDAHSLYLETLAELGPIGLLLVAGLLLYPVRIGVRLRSHPYVPAALGAYVAFLVHAGLDWDWEMPAVVVAALSCGAALVAGPGEVRTPLPRPARAVALVAAVVLGACAIAGARSHAVPSANADTKKAPLGGAF
jgi:O-Antigen ligase